MRTRWVIGIDEVGRGPLAGPVAVCALAAHTRVLADFRHIRESKQLSKVERERWYAQMERSRGTKLDYAVSFVSAKMIDKYGIVPAIRTALARSLGKLALPPGSCTVLLDGGLKAPPEYRQRTIVRGDETVTAIAMASVAAKVLRDRRMIRLHRRFPEYGFVGHVGYGTRKHINAIKRHGLSPEHRKSFCRKICGER